MSFLSVIFLLLSVLSFLTTLETSSLPSNSTNPKPKIFKLIHVDSIHSPLFDKDTTLTQRSSNALRNSDLRAMSLNSSNIELGTTPQNQGASFLVYLEFGSPPVSQYLSVDTGTSLTWVFCSPCSSCSYGNTTLYDYDNSELGFTVDCDEEVCYTEVQNRSCENGVCYYRKDYGGGDFSAGYMVVDITTVAPYNVIYFGCSGSSPLAGKFNGVFGMGMGYFSVFRQWQYTKFSYCFGNISDITDSTSGLIFGEIDIIPFYSTPFRADGPHYSIFPVAISFQGNPLNVDLSPLPTTGVFMDTSSTFTYFPMKVVVAIENVVQEFVAGNLSRASWGENRLCYYGLLTWDIGDFPSLTVHLAEGAFLVLPKENLFFQFTDNVFCLAIRPSLVEGTNIIGIIAQQGHVMSYDLESRRINLQQFDCTYPM